MATDETMPEPHLYASEESDAAAIARIEALDTAIKTRPEHYLVASHQIGQFVLGETVSMPNLPSKDLEVPKARLEMFLTNRDERLMEFDPASDKAIYGDPKVIELIAALKNHRGVIVKQGKGNYSHQENTRAIEKRNELSMYRLYLYIRRAMQWNQRQGRTSEQNSAA